MKQPWENALFFGKDKKLYLTRDNVFELWIWAGIPLVFVANGWIMDLFVKSANASFFFLYLFGSLMLIYLGAFFTLLWFDCKKAKQNVDKLWKT